ncbi:hypothetical protein R1flu_019631 [Riccia fluitans]|uniref:Uncharacterized protein n=1 Tax=Riccia fluitans TaxID=41844 RepID=A0ABD1ZJ82_9MARC
MAPHKRKDLKVKMKEMKIPHLTNANKKKMEAEVYNLPKASLGGYVMKGKVQFTELQLLRLMKGDKRKSKSGVFLEQVEGDSDFVLFCQMLNSVLAPVRLEHFHYNQLAFFHYAWVAIKDPTAPTPDWGDAVEKTMSRKVKALGVCNEATCLGPYLAHMCSHFHEMDNKEKEDTKKQEALEHTVFDSEIEMEDEKEPNGESPSHNVEKQVGVSRLTRRRR